MKKHLIFILTLLALCGCTTSESSTYDIYGNLAFRVGCPGVAVQMCYDQANKTCPHGYYLVDEDKSLMHRSITVRCK